MRLHQLPQLDKSARNQLMFILLVFFSCCLHRYQVNQAERKSERAIEEGRPTEVSTW